MKKYYKFIPYLVLIFSLILNSCSENDPIEEINSNLVNAKSTYSYIDYEQALDITSTLFENSRSFYDSLTPSNGDDAQEYVNDFLEDNSDLLDSTSNALNLESNLIPDNLYQFENYEATIDQINYAEFLTQIQKEYAIDILIAAQNNDINALINIKNSFKSDLITNPELGIFNMGIAMIENAEPILLSKSDDCFKDAVYAGILGGMLAMITGVISGGLGGVVVGGVLTGGVLAIPAGGAGAIIGAVAGGLGGFVSGFALEWLQCKLFDKI